jgi:hypothetical protein
MTSTLRLALAALAVACTHVAGRADPIMEDAPETLRETGFYSDEKVAFAPQYPLWTDGAHKSRWIQVPTGTHVDRSRDVWQFPIGTKLWKQFSFGGHVVETRFLMNTATGWRFATYVDGVRVRDGASSVEIAAGVRHQVPAERDCRSCHNNPAAPVLGYSALQLGIKEIPGSPVQKAALGYLHGNCGHCHRSDGPVASLGMFLATPDEALATTIGKKSRFMAPLARIAAGDAEHSVIVARMRSRSPFEQMPPLGTQLVDRAGVELLTKWIDQLEQGGLP